jgi:hypothetical protein
MDFFIKEIEIMAPPHASLNMPIVAEQARENKIHYMMST